MPHNGNWFAVSRTIFDHRVVGIHGRPYTELEAWLWMVSEAQFEPREVSNKGRVIVLDPGDLMMAHNFLAKAWMWSVDKVRWFLKRLQNEAMITRFSQAQGRANTNQIQIITICNYRDYQYIANDEHQPNTSQHPKPTPSEHQAAHQPDNVETAEETPLEHQPPKYENSDTHQAEPQELNTLTPNTEQKENIAADAASEPTPRAALEAFELYNEMAQRIGLPLAKTLTPQRRKSMMARMREHGGIEAWKTALANIERSKFLQGSNDRGWIATLDFLIQASRFTKVVEGAYGNGAHADAEPAKTWEERMRGYAAELDQKERKPWTP